MSSSNGRRKVRLNTVAVDLGCSCRRSRLLSAIFRRRPKKQSTIGHDYNSTYNHNYFYSDYTTPTTTTTASTFTPTGHNYFSDDNYDEDDEYSTDIKSLKAVQGFGRVGGESVAVEKDSDDPYLDFRRSMMRMIVEKEIYSKDDLRELLNCFLQLNSPYHHGIIIRAFSEIWNGVYYSAGRNGMGPTHDGGARRPRGGF